MWCNLSKAFDRGYTKAYYRNLNLPNGTLTQWFTDHIKDRKQRVVLPGALSDWCLIKVVVPQGSIIGRLLFLVFINDIVEEINSSIRLFADDTSLYIVVGDPLDSAIKLNIDISRINMLASMWLVTFNPSKSEALTSPEK